MEIRLKAACSTLSRVEPYATENLRRPSLPTFLLAVPSLGSSPTQQYRSTYVPNGAGPLAVPSLGSCPMNLRRCASAVIKLTPCNTLSRVVPYEPSSAGQHACPKPLLQHPLSARPLYPNLAE